MKNFVDKVMKFLLENGCLDGNPDANDENAQYVRRGIEKIYAEHSVHLTALRRWLAFVISLLVVLILVVIYYGGGR